MFLDQWFRLSGYLALALSCAALVFAEAPFLPHLQFCLLPVLALLLLAWWVEGRWQLPNWGANLLGVFIAAAGIAWLAEQMTDNDSLLKRIPFHLALLPYMGPLLMAALLVKVFGAREVGAFWRLQGLGLMQIGLGCVLDGGPVFGVLMIAYLAVALACLSLRYRQSVEPSRLACVSLPARGVLVFMFRWTLLIALPTLFLFLFMPRRDNAAWEPLNALRGGLNPGHMRVHASGEEINLNETGRLELDDEAAFEVVAVDAAGEPKLDLPPDQRWRGPVLEWYEKGKWRGLHPFQTRGSRGPQPGLPDFGPQQYFLTFTVPPRQPGAQVLAEPVCLGPPPTRLPVEVLSGSRRPRLFYELAGSVLPQMVNTRRERRYRQVVPASDAPIRLRSEGVLPSTYTSSLAHLPTALQSSVGPWTIHLLQRLSRQSGYPLPERVRAALAEPAKDFVLDPDDSEVVSRVLTDYLAASGEFTYTLDLARQDSSIDPILDFLFNIKQGHCGRYATALALMLRSVGIPARVVKGFRGCESLGEGRYVVRHRHAHAWVEALVPRRSSEETSAGQASRPVLEWLELDPTPADSFTVTSQFSLTYFWEEIQRLTRQGWQTLIVDYNADEQANLWDFLQFSSPLSSFLKLGLILPLILALCVVGMFWRRRLPRRASKGFFTHTAAFYQRLLQILSSYASLRPSIGQTPQEYGEAARSFLQGHPRLVVLAGLPLRVVDLFYRERFGGQPLSADERQVIDSELDRFAEMLRTEPRP